MANRPGLIVACMSGEWSYGLPIVYNECHASSFLLSLAPRHITCNASVRLRPLSFLCSSHGGKSSSSHMACDNTEIVLMYVRTGSRGQLPCTGGFSHNVLPTGPLLVASVNRKRHQRRRHLQRLCSRCEKGKRELESLWKLSTCRTLITASSRHTAGVSKCTSRKESSL